ncbi:hypothetical protein SAMN04488065_1267 [Haloplanus vescus]|uniref:Uncharacterized protein n=1 Tax=Haloplanus vescus TaxID=555874 RepID=A0A1H3X285_9EURY|nr:hypothetical protein [Haloplanus vescus]SDZ92744.1 hypothetical protein SAMN04488065_1267 [Haloplanus vescus]
MGWLEQKEKIDALNLFHSAIKSDTSNEGIASQGYKLVGPFLPVPDNRNDVFTRPEFTFYSGDTVIFVNVEPDDRVTEEHRRRAEDYERLNLEAVEDFIRKKGRADEINLSTRDLNHFEHHLVFDKHTVDSVRAGGPGADIYDDIKDKCGILSQSRGGELRFEGGLAQDDSFHSIVSAGIDLPPTPSKEFLLTGEIKPESLAVSLAQVILPEQFKQHKTVKMTPRRVPHYYDREMDLDMVRDTLEYLRYRGACDDIGTYEYSFSRENVSELYEVENHLRDTTIQEYLDKQGGKQFSMEEYLD